jgi:hypothetical protein
MLLLSLANCATGMQSMPIETGFYTAVYYWIQFVWAAFVRISVQIQAHPIT